MLIPNGTYRARATKGLLTSTKEGKPQLAVDFVITQSGECEGRHVVWRGFFTEKTQIRTIESLEHCGWTGTDITDLTGIDANEVELVIEHEDYTNEEGVTSTQAKVRWVNAIGGISKMEPMAEGAAKAFAATLKGHILGHRAAKNAKGGARNGGKSGGSSGGPPVDDAPMPDDPSIPF